MNTNNRNKSEKGRFRNIAFLWTTAVLCLALLAGTASADDWVGGLPLTTVQTDTVTGDLYISGNPPSPTFEKTVNRAFTLPEAAVAESGRIKWARLYVSSYCGHMQGPRSISYTTKVDWDNDGIWDNNWTETDNPGQCYYYPDSNGDYEKDGNDNSEFPGHGSNEPYLMLNNHTTRVTSDYFSWYDVADLIRVGEDTIKVNVDASASIDGRIKVVELVVAYDDPSSTTQTTYWVNEGHDVCSWYTEQVESVAVGSTIFNTSSQLSDISLVTSATLTVDYMASNNGYYGFPTIDNNFTVSGKTVSGKFTNALDRTPDSQGAYSGLVSWDVTPNISSSSDAMLGYSRYLPAAENDAFYKIPLAFLVVKNPLQVSQPEVDLSISGPVYPESPSSVFAREANPIKIKKVKNLGPDTATDITVALYASDVSPTVPVATTTIPSLAGGEQTSVTLTDPTIRDLEGGTVTYTATADPDNLIAETDESNNNKSSFSKPVKYNGYKGKGIYWEGGSNITTRQTCDLKGDLVYFTQPESAYKAVNWTGRTETWTGTDLPVPEGATVEKALLYISYNWDQTEGGLPDLTASFNGNTITPGTPYIDKSNFGSFADYEYGLYPAVNVTSYFKKNGNNTLVTTPNSGNMNALYPSTLVVIYSDPTETRKLIFINEECDELLASKSLGTTMEEATAYVPFTGMTIDMEKVKNATLHSFVGSAGPDEGNMLFNGKLVATNAWQGTLNTAYAQAFDVKSSLNSNGNEAAVQGTSDGGMAALQQILVVEYIESPTPDKPDLLVSAITPNANEIFANGTNSISAKVENKGTAASGPFTVNFSVNGIGTNVPVDGLSAGANTTLTITDTAIRASGDSIEITVSADSENSVVESNEANNALALTKNVLYNGYRGKRWTNGNDISTVASFEGNYGIVYSAGNTSYNGAFWTEKTYSWSASDLPVPEGASVVSARLYQPYTYNKMDADPAFTMSFNGNPVPRDAAYTDRKNFGSYDRPYGLYVYNVTALFNPTGNSITLSPEAENKYGIYGAYLIVVYRDPEASVKKIWINEEFDILYSYASNAVSSEEATAYAPFPGMDTTDLSSASAIAVLASAGDSEKSRFFFNEKEYPGFWPDYNKDPQIGFSSYDVTGAVRNGENTARFQSYDASKGDNMYAMNAILVADYAAGEQGNSSSNVSLNTTIVPAISLEVTPSALEFGKLSQGKTSDPQDLILNNTGGCSINVTARVSDSSAGDGLFSRGIFLDSRLWVNYWTVIGNNSQANTAVTLKVPSDYTGLGNKKGTITFWAEAAE